VNWDGLDIGILGPACIAGLILSYGCVTSAFRSPAFSL